MKKTFLISLALLPLLAIFAYGWTAVYAACPEQSTEFCVTLDNPFGRGGDSLFDLLRTIINSILMPIGGILAVLAFIYSGFLYVTAQGNEAKLKTAHKALLYTAIGTAILLGAWVLAKVICNTIGQLGG